MSLPPETTLEDVKVRIRESTKNQNVGKTEQVVLKDGPRAYKLATLIEILNPETGKVHHYTLKIDSIDRKKSGWFYKPEKSVALEGKETDEIQRLFYFLQAHLEGRLLQPGDLHIIKAEEYQKLENLVNLIPDLASPDMIELIKVIIPRISDASNYFKEFVEAFEGTDPDTVEHIAVAARLVKHKEAYNRMKILIEDGKANEQKYQDVLAANPWMFGSEYSELLDRRNWTRDDKLDFMLRRTSDNYLEIIEIKTPFKDALFLHDTSHDSYYPSAKLSPVLGQVIRYINELERNRDSIRSKDGCDILKIRARIIIGRDGDEAQQEALRSFNAHLHRIEILTFDQLMRIARRVLRMFESDEGPLEANINCESIPF